MSLTTSVQSITDSNCNALLTEMQDGHSDADVGISVALYYPNDSGIPSFFQYGWACPNEAETVYTIGSVTKVFTAALAAYLSVTGMIGALDQTLIASYLSKHPDS